MKKQFSFIDHLNDISNHNAMTYDMLQNIKGGSADPPPIEEHLLSCKCKICKRD